jgi:hypothetical protein
MKPSTQNNSQVSSRLIYSPQVICKLPTGNDIIRIELSDSFTKIDLCYSVPNSGFSKRTISISPFCFLHSIKSKRKLRLIKVVNIPYAPNCYCFKKANETLFYTLYFEPVKKGETIVSIQDSIILFSTPLNFRGVSLVESRNNFKINNN